MLRYCGDLADAFGIKAEAPNGAPSSLFFSIVSLEIPEFFMRKIFFYTKDKNGL